MKIEENQWLFYPDRLFIQPKEMFVSFNIISTVMDRTITDMKLHVHLLEQTIPFLITVQEIASGWDIHLMERGYRPLHPYTFTQITSQGGEDFAINLSAYYWKWRYNSLNNHGVVVQLPNQYLHTFSVDTNPYLIISYS